MTDRKDSEVFKKMLDDQMRDDAGKAASAKDWSPLLEAMLARHRKTNPELGALLLALDLEETPPEFMSLQMVAKYVIVSMMYMNLDDESAEAVIEVVKIFADSK